MNAQYILNQYWDGYLPVNVEAIANSLGIIVTSNPFISDSGFVSLEHQTASITINGSEPQVRQRFTLAHEIGHLALGHLSNGQKLLRDTSSNFSTGTYIPVEREANNFAAELLMPEDAVRWAVSSKKFKHLSELANLFFVSEAAMHWRLTNLNIFHF